MFANFWREIDYKRMRNVYTEIPNISAIIFGEQKHKIATNVVTVYPYTDLVPKFFRVN